MFALSLTGCDDAPKSRLVVETGAASQGFSELPGGIGVRFSNLPDDWSGPTDLMFRGGKVSWSKLFYGPRARGIAYSYPSVRKSFPKEVSGYRLDRGSVWEESRDGRFVALGAKPDGSGDSDSALAILDIERQALVGSNDGGGAWRIASLDWSPDGKYVAFIRSDWRVRGVFAGVADYVLGRPQDWNVSLWLVVVDRSGNIVARSQLTDEYEVAAGVVWTR